MNTVRSEGELQYSRDAGAVICRQSITFAKASPSNTLIARLISVDTQGAEQLLGEYAFHHTRTIPGPGGWDSSDKT